MARSCRAAPSIVLWAFKPALAFDRRSKGDFCQSIPFAFRGDATALRSRAMSLLGWIG